MPRNAEQKKRHRDWMRKRYHTDSVHREKQLARNAVGRAVKSGKLIKTPCVNCKNPKSQGHHEDYSRENRLNVEWLCLKCHKEKHGGCFKPNANKTRSDTNSKG